MEYIMMKDLKSCSQKLTKGAEFESLIERFQKFYDSTHGLDIKVLELFSSVVESHVGSSGSIQK